MPSVWKYVFDHIIVKIHFDNDSEIGDDATIFRYISNDGKHYNHKEW